MHSGALGWVAFISFGAIYYMVPALWRRSGLYSTKLVAWHYWVATLGIVFYISAMWVAGIMQGLMWRAYDRFGFLQYSFSESVEAAVVKALAPLLEEFKPAEKAKSGESRSIWSILTGA